MEQYPVHAEVPCVPHICYWHSFSLACLTTSHTYFSYYFSYLLFTIWGFIYCSHICSFILNASFCAFSPLQKLQKVLKPSWTFRWPHNADAIRTKMQMISQKFCLYNQHAQLEMSNIWVETSMLKWWGNTHQLLLCWNMRRWLWRNRSLARLQMNLSREYR